MRRQIQLLIFSVLYLSYHDKLDCEKAGFLSAFLNQTQEAAILITSQHEPRVIPPSIQPGESNDVCRLCLPTQHGLVGMSTWVNAALQDTLMWLMTSLSLHLLFVVTISLFYHVAEEMLVPGCPKHMALAACAAQRASWVSSLWQMERARGLM